MPTQPGSENHMGERLLLGVLDQAPIAEGSTGGDALRNSIDLARWTDELGYHRYWVAEHHATPMLACASPEVLIGPATPIDDNPHSIPVTGSRNPRRTALSET